MDASARHRINCVCLIAVSGMLPELNHIDSCLASCDQYGSSIRQNNTVFSSTPSFYRSQLYRIRRPTDIHRFQAVKQICHQQGAVIGGNSDTERILDSQLTNQACEPQLTDLENLQATSIIGAE